MEHNVDLVFRAMSVGVHGEEAFFLDQVAHVQGAPFLLWRGIDVDGLPPRGLSAACLCQGRLLCPGGSGSLLRCLGHGVRGVVVFVLVGGSSGVVVLVARAGIVLARAVALVVVVVVCIFYRRRRGEA